MTRCKKIIFLFIFVGSSFSVYAEGWNIPVNNEFVELESSEDVTNLDVQINGTTLFQMENVPTTGYLEVYSILGVKVTSLSLKSAASIGRCYLDLPKGIYIFKAGKVAKKIIVR